MDFERRAAEFRRAIARRGPIGPRLRYTPELRTTAIAYARDRLAAGAGLKTVTEELGVGRYTLRGWLVAADQAQTFRKVEVTDEPAPPRRLVVHGPHGLRIEGLAVVDLAELLRRLG